MESKIVETLEFMCDKSNPQDRKMLLLAELVESKCNALNENQKDLKKSLDNTNTKLDKLTDLLKEYEENARKCPVYINRANYEKVSFFIRYPKVMVFVILGVIALLGGFFGANFVELLDKLFKL